MKSERLPIQMGFINPVMQLVSRIECDRPTRADMYRILDCENIETVGIGANNERLVFDGHGRLHSVAKPAFQLWDVTGKKFHDILGFGLVVGIDCDGDWTSTSISLDLLKSRVTFSSAQEKAPKAEVRSFSSNDELLAFMHARRFSIK